MLILTMQDFLDPENSLEILESLQPSMQEKDGSGLFHPRGKKQSGPVTPGSCRGG